MRTIIGVLSVLIAIVALAAVIAIKAGVDTPEEAPWKKALAEGRYIPLSDSAEPMRLSATLPPESAIQLLVPPPPAELPSVPPTEPAP